MDRVVMVRFEEAGRKYYFHAHGLELSLGEQVVVETEQGLEVGWVTGEAPAFPADKATMFLSPVVRKATREDQDQARWIREKEREAFQVCREKIKARSLPMKLVGVKWSFDGTKAVFYFTAEEKVDFWELVKDLAHEFQVRINVRQIGARDEARMMGGIGCCGRPLCCQTFLREFEPVSIRMAKEQNLSLNPSKISGICGRLMCCLAFEYGMYEEIKKGLPHVGCHVKTPHGPGIVKQQVTLEESIVVTLKSGVEVKCPAAKCSWKGGEARPGL